MYSCLLSFFWLLSIQNCHILLRWIIIFSEKYLLIFENVYKIHIVVICYLLKLLHTLIQSSVHNIFCNYLIFFFIISSIQPPFACMSVEYIKYLSKCYSYLFILVYYIYPYLFISRQPSFQTCVSVEFKKVHKIFVVVVVFLIDYC